MDKSGRLSGRSWRRLDPGAGGFTVIELVAVMALLGLLSTMGLIIGRNVARRLRLPPRSPRSLISRKPSSTWPPIARDCPSLQAPEIQAW
ncbi:MAG: hypothetical protein DMD77_18185 [Candidatus Rokuibacteriota bacterium]|nr:MAG: hypothetical protein DMD77_18185 [Candidatus Rokubacteria bacterium]